MASLLAASTVAAALAGPARFSVASEPYRFVFPRDHGAHDGYQSEWWYYTGHLEAAGGRRFGYELTFFRVGLRPGDPARKPGQSVWRGTQLFPAHFAITDESGGRFVYFERLAREALGAGFASREKLDVRAGNWSVVALPAGAGGAPRMKLHARGGEHAVDLLLTPLKPPAVHGHRGVSRKASCPSCASHYYSFTRLKTTGTLRDGGRPLRVAGLSWMDHEFGSGELQPDQAGWDWFALQFDDGRELMLYRLRQKDGSVTLESSGSAIDRAGRVRYLPLAQFSIEARATWKSPHTGASYPAGWRIRIPSEKIDLRLTPTIPDQELANASGVSYWEGSVDLTDVAHGDRHAGRGYVELTGYAGAVHL